MRRVPEAGRRLGSFLIFRVHLLRGRDFSISSWVVVFTAQFFCEKDDIFFETFPKPPRHMYAERLNFLPPSGRFGVTKKAMGGLSRGRRSALFFCPQRKKARDHHFRADAHIGSCYATATFCRFLAVTNRQAARAVLTSSHVIHRWKS